MRDYAAAVYIGRFQPFHNGHLEVVKHGLEIADKVVIVVGSINSAPNIRNPWSFEERKTMIKSSVEEAQLGVRVGSGWDVEIVGVRDYHYNMNNWIAEVQSKTDPFLPHGQTIAMLGQYKDSSSYYLKHFPQWRFEPLKTNSIDATAIRTRLLRESYLPDWEGKLPDARRLHMQNLVDVMPIPTGTHKVLSKWIETPEFMNLMAEFKFINDYKSAWASSPYPPSFNAADAIVVCSGHVLVIRRKINPGKGLLALPGGFIRLDETTEQASLRELREETGIRVEHDLLKASIRDSHVFDHPQRSLRGRTYSHGFYIKLPDGKLPEVSAGDDAAQAMWLPLIDVATKEREFFDDHAHIINFFTSQGGN